MKILYGVPSEGMGHATRSRVVIEFLMAQGHEVIIVTSDRAYTFLESIFGKNVIAIEGFHLAYKNAAIDIAQTALLTLKESPKQLRKNFEVYQNLLQKHTINLVISDFESFTNFYAKLQKIPLISIDNMQVINRSNLDIDIPKSEKMNFKIAKAIIKVKVPKAYHYYITSFFNPSIRKKRSSYILPIIRQAIIEAKTSTDEHILVYQTSNSQKNLVEILNQLPNEKFIVYGFNKDETIRNVALKKFSEEEFIKYFASAKAVISNGGFSFISEAIYLHKPICCVPIKNQFEQFVNTCYVQKLKYGRQLLDFSKDGIQSFLMELPIYNLNLIGYKQNGNEQFFTKFSKVLKLLKAQEK